ncbi:hypothetical protein SEA_VITAS_54 [Microbacterium phage Vitas]|uniref:Uncharacterized protein n=1 Tax=Microbacterium phage Vitas TaxID=2603259 RepID=A0A5B8WI94_9CAUD|nr:hypothetical protein SEA_VITAS_54 [Microbacterium phage Vitas]
MKCQVCKRRKATHVIRNAFASSANGKRICSNTECFRRPTGGYPAEARLIRG